MHSSREFCRHVYFFLVILTANCLGLAFFLNCKELSRYYKGADICLVVASVSHMLTLRSGVILSAKVSFLSVLSQVIVNLKSLNSGFLFYCKDDSFFVFVLFLFQVAFEDPEVQGIYLLTDGKPVSLHFMPCPQLKCFAEKSNWEINC